MEDESGANTLQSFSHIPSAHIVCAKLCKAAGFWDIWPASGVSKEKIQLTCACAGILVNIFSEVGQVLRSEIQR